MIIDGQMVIVSDHIARYIHVYELHHGENMFYVYGNNKVLDQPVHWHSLSEPLLHNTSSFFIRKIQAACCFTELS